MLYPERMPLVRTKLEPWREIDVSDEEYLRLRRLDLIYTGEPVTPPLNFTDGQYAELANPEGEAAKRVVQAVGASDIVAGVTASVLTEVDNRGFAMAADVEHNLEENFYDRTQTTERVQELAIQKVGAAEAVLDELSANDTLFGASPIGSLTSNNSAIQAAVTAAGARPVRLKQGRYAASLSFTGQSVNIQAPNSVLVQQQAKSVLEVTVPLGAPINGFTQETITFGPNSTSSTSAGTRSLSQRLTKITVPGGDYRGFKTGDIYHFTSNDALPYSAQATSTAGDACLGAEYSSILAIGVDVISVANGGPREGTVLTTASSSFVPAVIQSSIAMDGTVTGSDPRTATWDGVTTAKLTLASIQSPLSVGDDLYVAGSIVGQVSAVYLLFNKVLRHNYVTSNKMSKLNTDVRVDIDIVIDADGDTDSLVGAGNRQPAVVIMGAYMPRVRVKIKGAWTRAIRLVGCYNPIGVAWGDGLPNHAITDEGAFGYLWEIRGATTGGAIQAFARRVRHAVTTNPTPTKPSGALSYAQINPLWLGAGEGVLVHDSVGIDCYGAAFDTHEGMIHMTFADCVGITSASAARFNSTGGVFSNRSPGTRMVDCVSIGGVDGFSDGSQGINTGSAVYRSVIDGCVALDFQRDGVVEGIPTLAVTGNGLDIINTRVRGDGSAQGQPHFQKGFHLGRSGASRVRIFGNCIAERFNYAPIWVTSSVSEVDVHGFFADYTECDVAAVGFGTEANPTINLWRYSLKSTSSSRPPSILESMTGSATWNYDPAGIQSVNRVSVPFYRVGTGSPTFNNRRVLEPRSLSTRSETTDITLGAGDSTIQILTGAVPAEGLNLNLPTTVGLAFRSREHRFSHRGSGGSWSIRYGSTVVKTIAPGQFVDVSCIGTTWVVTASGSL